MYSPGLVEVPFWLARAGAFVYVFAMWNSGIIQGLMWRTYVESGTLAYSFVDSLLAMHPSSVARAVGGLLFHTGAVVGFYNLWLPIRAASAAAPEAAADGPLVAPAPRRPSEAGDLPAMF